MANITADEEILVGPNGEPIAEEMKNIIVRFVLATGRKTKRALYYSGHTIAEGTRVVGRGVKATAPYLATLAMIALGMALFLGGLYLNYLFIQFAFTVSPVIGWVLVVLTVFQVMAIFVGMVFGVISYLTGSED